MTDTTPEMQRIWDERWRQVPPAERLRMGCEMFGAAKALAVAGIRAEMDHEDETEVRRRLFRRFYSGDFEKAEMEKIILAICG